MMGPGSTERFNRAADNGYLNIEIFYKDALSTFIKWPDDALQTIYRDIYND